MKPTIDYITPAFHSFLCICILSTAYGGDWINALGFGLILGTDMYLNREKRKILPRRTFL
jgi:hypothetical protein